MATVNAVSLPKTSSFKSVDQTLLPKDPKAKAQAPKQDKDKSEEKKGTESPEMKELSQQIDSHIMVLNEDNLRTTANSTIQDVTQPALSSNPPITSKAPMTGPIIPDNPST